MTNYIVFVALITLSHNTLLPLARALALELAVVAQKQCKPWPSRPHWNGNKGVKRITLVAHLKSIKNT